MYEAAVLGTLLLVLVAGADYIRRAWIHEINPVPATWILMMVMMSISFWTYWQNPAKSWTGNIGVTANTLNIAIILAGVIATNIRYGTFKVAFDKGQKWCLAGGAGVVAFWFLTKAPLPSYLLVQCIALIAYFATARRLWKATSSTEPLFFWIASLLSNLCALYPAWVRNDLFAWIFLARAIPSTALLVYLIARIKGKMRRANELIGSIAK